MATVKFAHSTSPRPETVRAIGRKLGYFSEFGINLEVVQLTGAPNILRAMISGEVLFAASEPLTTIASIETGSPIKVLGPYESKLEQIFFAQPGISRLKDLEGHSVGVTASGSLIDNIARELLRRDGADLSKIEFSSLTSSSAIYQALAAKQITAGLVPEAYLPTAERDGLVPIVKALDVLPDFLSSCFFATEQAIQEHRDLIVRVLAAHSKTFGFVSQVESKEVWMDVAVNEIKQDPAQAEVSWQGVIENHVYDRNLQVTPAQLEYVQGLNIENGKQQAVLPFERITDLSLAQEAVALAAA